MNEVLKQLEASGLVEREQSHSNARILNAHLTHAGKKKWRSVDHGVQELEERLLRGLTQDEIHVLNRSLETIIRNMTPTP
jgi:DNA-binding MarR family transcriptional regulator